MVRRRKPRNRPRRTPRNKENNGTFHPLPIPPGNERDGRCPGKTRLTRNLRRYRITYGRRRLRYDEPRNRNSYPSISRCSSFAAWGGATKNGKLITAGNSDYYDTEEELRNRPIAVIDPTDGGYGYTAALWDVFFTASGINETGIAVNGQLAGADSESLRGVSAELLLGLILQYADSIEDAVEILTVYPRTCGIVVLVTDAKTNRAAVIEYTAGHIAVRFAEPGKNILWATNHFNCFPGWQGYAGFNMAPTYDQRAKLADIGTIEKWQDSLEKIGKGRAGRYERYRNLLEKNHGNITVEKAKEIVSDRYSVMQNKVLLPTEATGGKDYPVMVRQHDWVMSKNIKYYKRERRGELRVKSGNVSSFIAVPATGDIWWAVGIPPAAYTAGYTHINLPRELARNRKGGRAIVLRENDFPLSPLSTSYPSIFVYREISHEGTKTQR